MNMNQLKDTARYDTFKTNHKNSLETIEMFLDGGDELSKLAKWMLNTEANPYSFLPKDYAGSFNSAEGFASLLHALHHSMYDDGEMSFVLVAALPKIVFRGSWEDDFYSYILEDESSRFLIKEDAEVLDISPEDFGSVYEGYHVENIKKCFVHDAAVRGMDFANNHYSSYDFYTEDWQDTLEEDINTRREMLKKVGVI